MEWVTTYAVHSTALIAAVWLLTSVIPKLSLGTRETLWKVALLGPLATATVVQVAAVPSVWGQLPMPEALRTEPTTVAQAPTPAPAIADEGPVVERRVVRHRNGDLEITAVRHRRSDAAAAPVVVAAPTSAEPSPSPWPLVLLGLWGLGAAVALGRLGWSAARLHKQLKGRRDVIEDPVLESFLELCDRAGLKKRPRLTASSHLRSPIALGRKEICLPERAVDSLSREQQQGMLAHEMAHLLRRDPVWSVGIAVVEAVFFFQPLNHLARRKIQEVAEFQCDDWAARQSGTGVHLAKCLAEVAGWVEDGPPLTPAVVPMAERGSPIVRRITRLLHERRRAGGRVHPVGRVALTVGAMGMVIALVPGVTQAASASPSKASTKPMLAQASGTPEAVIFEDRSDDGHERSKLRLSTGDEVVEIEVQAARPAPPPPPPPPEPPADERVEIMIHGHFGGHPWFGPGWWGGAWIGGVLDFGGVEIRIEEDLYDHHPLHPEHRAWDRIERARERAERAQQRAERKLERAMERLERRVEREVERELDDGWPTIFGVTFIEPSDDDRDDERSVVIEL